MDLAPGEFFDELRLNPRISASTIEGLRSQYGIGQTLPVKYFRWLISAAKGDCGYSLAYNSPAAPIVWIHAEKTLLLTGTATFFAWLIALPFGLWSAARPGKAVDVVARGMTSTLLATPDVLLALLFLSFAVRSRYFPAGGVTAHRFFTARRLVEIQRSGPSSLSSQRMFDGGIPAAACCRTCGLPFLRSWRRPISLQPTLMGFPFAGYYCVMHCQRPPTL